MQDVELPPAEAAALGRYREGIAATADGETVTRGCCGTGTGGTRRRGSVSFSASPRIQGEAGIERVARIPGEGSLRRNPTASAPRGNSPSPRPSPRKRGEGVHRQPNCRENGSPFNSPFRPRPRVRLWSRQTGRKWPKRLMYREDADAERVGARRDGGATVSGVFDDDLSPVSPKTGRRNPPGV